jgi:hypothetical protein
MSELDWWDQFYTEMEKGLSSCGRTYTRPKDWKERAMTAETKHRKPVRNQYEGLTLKRKPYLTGD